MLPRSRRMHCTVILLLILAVPFAYCLGLGNSSATKISRVRLSPFLDAVQPDVTPPVWPAGNTIIATRITSSSLDIGYSHASDDSGIVNYKILVNGAWDGMWHMDNSYYAYNMFGMSSLPSNTTYTFQIIAVDPSGSQSEGPSATFSTAPQSCAGYETCLVFMANYDGIPYPGATIVLVGTFTNSGQDTIRVLGMNVTGDFGSYIKEGPVLSTGQTANRTINVVIPSNETLGPHMIDFFVSWQYQKIIDQQWYYGSNFWKNSTLTVVSRPSSTQLPGTLNRLPSLGWLTGMLAGVMSYGWLIIALYTVLVSLGSIMVVKRDMRKREALRKASR